MNQCKIKYFRNLLIDWWWYYYLVEMKYVHSLHLMNLEAHQGFQPFHYFLRFSVSNFPQVRLSCRCQLIPHPLWPPSPSCPQSFWASGSSPMTQLLASGGLIYFTGVYDMQTLEHSKIPKMYKNKGWKHFNMMDILFSSYLSWELKMGERWRLSFSTFLPLVISSFNQLTGKYTET